jgi:hypothetical protein
MNRLIAILTFLISSCFAQQTVLPILGSPVAFSGGGGGHTAPTEVTASRKTCDIPGAGTTNCQFGGTLTAGSLPIAIVTCNNPSAVVTGVSDPTNGAYTKAVHIDDTSSGNSSAADIWYFANNSATTQPTVSVVVTGTCDRGVIYLAQYTGAPTTSPLDQKNTTGSGTSATPSATTAGATTLDHELVIAVLSFGGSANTATAGTGYTLIAQDNSPGRSAYETGVAAATGSVTAGFSLTSAPYALAIATFKGL